MTLRLLLASISASLSRIVTRLKVRSEGIVGGSEEREEVKVGEGEEERNGEAECDEKRAQKNKKAKSTSEQTNKLTNKLTDREREREYGSHLLSTTSFMMLTVGVVMRRCTKSRTFLLAAAVAPAMSL
jgi:hypothetical protein